MLFRSGRTSASVLESAYKKGAKLYSCDSLHGKVIVFDHHVILAPRIYQKIPRKILMKDEAIDTKSYHYAYTKDCVIEWTNFYKLANMVDISRLGSGLKTMRELTERQSNALFALWST